MAKRMKLELDERSSAVGGEMAVGPESSLILLPKDALSRILSFDRPSNESQVWEWIGKISLTCKTVRSLAQELAPTDFTLEDFKNYRRLGEHIPSRQHWDARSMIIKALCKCSWMRVALQEIHVNNFASVSKSMDFQSNIDEYLITLLRSLITTPNSLPNLQWLDISTQRALVNSCNLIDEDSLLKLPAAVPSLRKLCLGACFRSGEGMEREISPLALKRVFSSLPLLTSLSLFNPGWLTDEHVAAIMPIIGKSLTRLELISCIKRGYSGESGMNKVHLTDLSLESIASNCGKLTSFAVAESHFTTAGLEKVFKANPSIDTLNLSYCEQLDERVMSVISSRLAHLKAFRCYWSVDRHDSFGGTRKDLWFNDETVMSLIKAQEKEHGASDIPLEVLGILKRTNVTSKALGYAVERGVHIELDYDHKESSLLHDLIRDIPNSEVLPIHNAKYGHYIDGSRASEKDVVLGLSEIDPDGIGFGLGMGGFLPLFM